jgi:hypothetical protein
LGVRATVAQRRSRAMHNLLVCLSASLFHLFPVPIRSHRVILAGSRNALAGLRVPLSLPGGKIVRPAVPYVACGHLEASAFKPFGKVSNP